jgi:hypothetical protein
MTHGKLICLSTLLIYKYVFAISLSIVVLPGTYSKLVIKLLYFWIKKNNNQDSYLKAHLIFFQAAISLTVLFDTELYSYVSSTLTMDSNIFKRKP